MKVRILNDTIPDRLVPHLDGHQVTVGREARRELTQEIDAAYAALAEEYQR